MQIVSAVVDRVAALSLFQRTAQWVMPQENPEYTDQERAELRDQPDQLAATHQRLSDMFDLFANAVVDTSSAEIKFIEQACLANLEDNVHDPELRERLRPDYQAACKRLIISPDFYAAIQQPNAELVTDRIQGIEPAGVRTVDGRLHELDVLVLATGFKADSFMRPMEVIGRHGRSLEQAWDPRPEAYLSISDPRVPQLLHAQRPQRPHRELLAHRSGRAPVRLHHAAHRAHPVRRVSPRLRPPGGPGRVRARPREGVRAHGLGHRVSELVPR